MKGEVSIRIRNNKNEYEFTLRRNITILCGDSGTGKTTLYNMVRNYSREGRASGVRAQVSGNVPVTVLEGNFWMDEIRRIQNSVVLVDEDSSFLRSEDFASSVKGSSNYYLLITRNYLPQLPYSVDEIYFPKGKKTKHFERLYLDERKIYVTPAIPVLPFRPELVITEDSNAGFQFFQSICSADGIDCIAAGGKSLIIRKVKENIGKKIAVVADGAAFGPEIADLAEIQKVSGGTLALFLSESFEWLILKSGLVCDPALDEVNHPERFAESSDYISWENYFTALLIKKSGEKGCGHYSKRKLDPWYLQDSSIAKLRPVVQPLDL